MRILIEVVPPELTDMEQSRMNNIRSNPPFRPQHEIAWAQFVSDLACVDRHSFCLCR